MKSFSRIKIPIIFAAIAVFAVLSQLPQNNNVMLAQANLKQPNVSQNTTTSVKWTAGTLNNGGHSVTITASTASVTLSESSCAAPNYTACNFVYANSAGTVSVTTSFSAAMGIGNSLMAYVETNGSIITKISYPLQASTAGLARIVESCGGSVACVPVFIGPGIMEAYGSAPLSSASPSIASITNLPFTGATTYVCTASPVGTTAAIAAAGIAINQTSGAAMTLTGPNTVTTVINYHCIGT